MVDGNDGPDAPRTSFPRESPSASPDTPAGASPGTPAGASPGSESHSGDHPRPAPGGPDEPGSRDLWDEIGFSRPLSGFWFRLVFEISTILVPILFVSFMLKYVYPYPTSLGYKTTFTGIFVLIFAVFDVGTANTITRFIADVNIKNPVRMIHYIQYFIWYQAFTGLAQITIISWWALAVAPHTELAYGIYIMLTCIVKQWPGFPGVFKGTLSALQQYNKSTTIDFLQGEAVQRFTEIGFVLLGKWIGGQNPAVGEMLGISIGAVFGLYIDDVIAALFSGWYLAKTLRPYGISFKRMFRVEFDRALVKECLTFGIKSGLPSLVFSTTKMISLVLALQYIPQYTTFIVLQDMAYMLVATSQRLVYQDFTPLFTEAYQNGKIRLCQYYHAHAFRFFVLNTCFAWTIMFTAFSVFERAFLGLGLTRYLLTLPFLMPALIYRSTKTYERYVDSLFIAGHKPTQLMVLKFIEEGGKILCWYLTIAVFRVHTMGIAGIVYTLQMGDYPAIILKNVIAYIYVHKRIFRFKFMVWQTFGAPVLATLCMYGLFRVLVIFVLTPLWDWNFLVGLVIAIVALLVLVLVLYFPLTVFFGGWDDNSVRDFRRVQEMAGPSKFIVKPLAKLVFATVEHSTLHNKFKYEDPAAFQELHELIALRDRNRARSLGQKSLMDNEI